MNVVHLSVLRALCAVCAWCVMIGVVSCVLRMVFRGLCSVVCVAYVVCCVLCAVCRVVCCALCVMCLVRFYVSLLCFVCVYGVFVVC